MRKSDLDWLCNIAEQWMKAGDSVSEETEGEVRKMIQRARRLTTGQPLNWVLRLVHPEEPQTYLETMRRLEPDTGTPTLLEAVAKEHEARLESLERHVLDLKADQIKRQRTPPPVLPPRMRG